MTILLLLGLAAYGLITFISVVNRDSYNLDETVYTLGSEEWDVDWRDFRIYNRTAPDCDKNCKLLTTRQVLPLFLDHVQYIVTPPRNSSDSEFNCS